jgi:two-component system NtrC family sensor kinase
LTDKVFEPFFTTREVGQGMGLGLSVSYSVVREHGGSIRIGHAPQGGALVTLELPVMPPDGQGRGAAGGRTKGRPRVQRVLVADDEPVILDLMVDLLGERGYRVDTATTGREALAKLSAGRYDAVVVDLRMPEMDGIQLYQEMARHAPALRARVVFATGDTVEESTRRFLAATGQPVLTKPFEIDKVLGALEGLLSATASLEDDAEPVSKR